jgi:NADPH:quinone reductase
MMEAGRLMHNVAATFPLADIVKAHETVEQGKAIGNVVIEVA